MPHIRTHTRKLGHYPTPKSPLWFRPDSDESQVFKNWQGDRLNFENRDGWLVAVLRTAGGAKYIMDVSDYGTSKQMETNRVNLLIRDLKKDRDNLLTTFTQGNDKHEFEANL